MRKLDPFESLVRAGRIGQKGIEAIGIVVA